MSDNVIVQIENEVAFIFLNEIKTLNALTDQLKESLINVLDQLSKDVSVKVLILAGNGKGFCAGGNLKQMGGNESPIMIKKKMEQSAQIVRSIQNIRKPVISVVHGFAMGAGFSIALASDMIIAEENVKFGLSFKDVGLIPDLGAHYFITRLVGPWKAKQWFWEGKQMTAQEGFDHGFVCRVTPVGKGLDEAAQVAQEIAQGPLDAFAMTKSILNNTALFFLDSILDQENHGQSLLRQTEYHKEAVQLFLNKKTKK